MLTSRNLRVDTRDVAMAAAAILALDEEGLRTHEVRCTSLLPVPDATGKSWRVVR